jgi:hypothetical protein
MFESVQVTGLNVGELQTLKIKKINSHLWQASSQDLRMITPRDVQGPRNLGYETPDPER